MNSFAQSARTCLFLAVGTALSACGGDSVAGAGSNRARFEFNVDLQGVRGVLTMEVEVVSSAGIVWGPGANPSITGVIGTGDTIIYTAGELRSPAAYYVFTGQNNFADFTEPATSQRFRVQWIETPTGMVMVANPFGPGPARYNCVLTSAVLL